MCVYILSGLNQRVCVYIYIYVYMYIGLALTPNPRAAIPNLEG